jgi:hypothetical protein
MNIDNLVILTSLGCFVMVLLRYSASLKVRIISSGDKPVNRVAPTGRQNADQL